MKKFFAVILILIITAAVLCLVGAGVLALFPNKYILNLPVAFVNVKTQKEISPSRMSESQARLDEELYNSPNNVKFIVETENFDVNVEYLETENTLFIKKDIYIVMNARVLGFSTSKDLEINWKVEQDLTEKTVTITTKQPSGWLFSNRCTLDVYIPRTNLHELVIKTNGKVNVKKGFTKIENLSITSNSNEANNALVNSPVGKFTLNSPNGSGEYDTFNGDLVINSKNGSFKFKQINGNVTAAGTSMLLNIENLTGDLNYNVEYGKGVFGTIGKTAKFVSKGTDVTIENLVGTFVIEEGGNSTFDIKNNGTAHTANGNVVKSLNNGILKIANSYYKTTIYASDGKIEIKGAKDIVEINPKKTSSEVVSSKVDVDIEFDSNISNINPITTSEILTICTNGNITAKNLVYKVYIEGQNPKMNIEFAQVNAESKIIAASSEIAVKVPNNQSYSIIAEVEDKSYISVDVGGTQTNNIAHEVENTKNGTWTLTYNFNNGSSSNIINIFTRETLTITALGN